MMRKLLAGVAVACALATFGGHAHSGPDCGRAKQELGQAQAALSHATRQADEKAAAYADCMQKSDHNGRACATAKRAMTSALRKRLKARDAYRFALAKKQRACR